MEKLTNSAKLFIGAITLGGIVTAGAGAMYWACSDYPRFFAFLVFAVFASALKVRVPGMTTTMSVYVPLVLLAIVELSFSEAVIISALCAITQCVWKARRRPHPVQLLFNACGTIVATGLAYGVYASSGLAVSPHGKILALIFASCAFFVANSLPVAIIIALTEEKQVTGVCGNIFVWMFPYYVLSAGVAVTTITATQYVAWQAPFVILPVMYLVSVSYRRYFRPVVATAENGATSTAEVAMNTSMTAQAAAATGE